MALPPFTPENARRGAGRAPAPARAVRSSRTGADPGGVPRPRRRARAATRPPSRRPRRTRRPRLKLPFPRRLCSFSRSTARPGRSCGVSIQKCRARLPAPRCAATFPTAAWRTGTARSSGARSTAASRGRFSFRYARPLRTHLRARPGRHVRRRQDLRSREVTSGQRLVGPQPVHQSRLAHQGLRLPILLGGLPLALGTGVGSELRQPLGIAIVGGLCVSQLLTLYITPVVYYYLDKVDSYLAGQLRKTEEAAGSGSLKPAE